MRHSFRPSFVATLLCIGLVSACAPLNRLLNADPKVAEVTPTCATNFTPCGLIVRHVEPSPIKFTAVGYGTPGSYVQYMPAQQKLMAMRAAQVDAYRNLAEQVQGFRVTGNTSVSAFAIQNDSVRTYVDSFIRGAHVISITAIADGNFQANVELEITNQFIDCITNFGNCPYRYPTFGCVSAGCTSSSSVYYSY